MQLKILSWNIWYDGDFDKISKFLNESKADIIGLQEVVTNDPKINVITYLSSLGYKHVFAPAFTTKDSRIVGNAVFSKYPVVSTQAHILSDEQSRNAVQTDIKVDDKILHVFSTHLLHTHQHRSEIQDLQADNLIKASPADHVIVMGDFNATPDSSVISKMRGVMIDSNSAPNPTLNAELFDCPNCDVQTIPHICLDYIFTSEDIKTMDPKVENSKGSDHLPISVNIEI